MMENSKCGEVCGDNRFDVIEKAKKHLIESTNISSSQDEMKVLDSFLFRCWQMGWLNKYDDSKTIEINDKCFELFVYAESLFDSIVCNDWYEGNNEDADMDVKSQMDRIRKVISIISKYDKKFPFGEWITASEETRKEYPDGLTEKTLEKAFENRYWKESSH